MQSTDASPIQPRWFRYGVAGLVALYVALFFSLIALTYERVPTFDALDWTIIYQLRKAAGEWATYFWDAHNVHRIAFARALLAIDIEAFRGTGIPFIVAGLVAWAALTAALLRECAVAALSREARAIAMIAVILLFSGTQLAMLISVPTYAVFMHTTCFVVLAIVLLNHARESQCPKLRFAAAMLCAALAPFGLSGGLLVWPVLVWLAWRTGYSLSRIALIVVLGAAEWTIYFSGLVVTEGMVADVNTTISKVQYALQLLALPWSRPALLTSVASIGGAIVLTLAAFLGVRTTLQANPTPLQRTGAALILFAFLVAVAAAFARSGIAPERGVPIRYAIFAAMAQLGIVFASAEEIGGLLRRFDSAILRTGALAILLLFAVQQIAIGASAVAVIRRSDEQWRLFERQGWTADMASTIHHTRERAELALELFRQHGLYGVPRTP